MDELIGEFVSETRETLERIAGALIAWEIRPDDPVQLDEIFRFVHTVKGSCGFLDLPRIAALAHAAETALAAVRSGTRRADGAMVATMLAIIDRLRILVDALETGETTGLPDPATDAVLVTALEKGEAVSPSGEADTDQRARTVRIGVPLLEAMMNQVSELVLVRNEIARALRRFEDREISAGFDRLGAVVGELRESVTRTRMQPIERLFATLPRLVRDTARECGKQVTLEISGQDVEIDREMVEAIRDPLVHIVRNAIDHGIEAPADRRAAGKPETSVLHVTAMQSGNQVSIDVSDDGRGLDTARIVAKAVAAKIIDAPRAALLDDRAKAALIFQAGLSTAEQVTKVSGRGVGMDVVRANVERLGGAVTLANRPGQGLSITLRAPLTLSIVNALIVNAGGQRFAIPRGAIDEVVPLRAGGARVEDVGGGLIAVVRGLAHPAFDLAGLLKLREGGTDGLLVMLSTATGGHYGLVVDAVGDHEELVVRPMAPQLSASGLYAGQTLGNDGQPLLVLDPVGLMAVGGVARTETVVETSDPSETAVASASVLLAVAHDGTRIAVRASGIERLIELDPRDLIAVEGQRLALVDGANLPAFAIGEANHGGELAAALIADGTVRAVLIVARVDDLVPLPETTPIESARFEGVFRHVGEAYCLIDLAALLEPLHAKAAERSRPVGETRRAA